MPQLLQARVSAEQLHAHRCALFLVEKPIFDALSAARQWGALSALHRINALTCCKSAEHGWPASCFSCIEILIAAHTAMRDVLAHRVVLSKGHAAAAQYALLAAEGCFPMYRLLNYKDGARRGAGDETLEAHADLYCDTGSLGQCLSVTAGFAKATPDQMFCVVLGDGELQEGQNYEALMAVRQHRIANLIVVVDINGFQSEARCDTMMRIVSLSTVLNGFGYDVEAVDGHSVQRLEACFRRVVARCHDNVEIWRPLVVLATTIKGGGTALMPTEVQPVTQCTVQPWHTRIPSWSLYQQIVSEQLAIALASLQTSIQAASTSSTMASDEKAQVVSLIDGLQRHWLLHCEQHMANPQLLANALRVPPLTAAHQRARCVGTGTAFGQRLCCHLNDRTATVVNNAPLSNSDSNSNSRHHRVAMGPSASAPVPTAVPPVAIVSADLVASCGIVQGVGHPHFFEMGVAEQNAVSFAAGLAMPPDATNRLIPVVCTYANFLKRACEQIFINVVQGAHMIYAGHYSGLCYTTDGKSHQSFNDTSLFLSMPAMRVVDPLNARHATRCLDVAVASLRAHPATPAMAQHASPSSAAGLSSTRGSGSWYFRLRRTPIGCLDGLDNASVGGDPLQPMRLFPLSCAPGNAVDVPSSPSSRLQPPPAVLLVMGTVAAAVALDCVVTLPGWGRTHIIYVPCLQRDGASMLSPSMSAWQRIFDEVRTAADCSGLLTIEDDIGALFHAACAASVTLCGRHRRCGHRPPPRIVGKTVSVHGPSFRCLPDALEHFGFTPAKLQEHWDKMTTPNTSSTGDVGSMASLRSKI